MKRNNCIENIQLQINAKIAAQTNSEKDFIVFRPKSQLAHPILTKQTNNMTSIFELENKRKNQNFLLKLRCKSKEVDEKNFEVDDHLHIQKCKTFKKFKFHKDMHYTALQPFKAHTSQACRQNSRKDIAQIRQNIKKGFSSRSQKKYRNICLGEIQKKKNIDSLLFYESPNNISFHEKENITGSININRLRPSFQRPEIINYFPLHLFSESPFENDHIKTVMKKPKETHKRIQTQLPANNLLKFALQKPKKPFRNKLSKGNPSFLQKTRRKEENFVFKPWQTVHVYEKEEQFEEFQNCS